MYLSSGKREALGTDEFFVAMVGFVLGGFCEGGHKGMNSAKLVVGDDHEERKQCPPDGEQVIVSWFPFEGGKGVICLFEEAGDGVGRHIWLIVVDNNHLQARGVFFRTKGAGRVP
jgi:hypothetical protein